MAIITIAAPLDGIRGKLAGLVFSAGFAGPYAKAFVMPTQARTQRRSEQRARIAYCNRAWLDLSVAQRALWDTWAALPAQARTNSLGETYYPSGFNQFCCINTRLLVVGRATRTAVPTNTKPATPSITSLTVNSGAAGTKFVTYPVDEFDTYDFICFGAIRPYPGVVTEQAGFHLVGADQSPGETETYITTRWNAVFGDARATNRAYAWVACQTTDGMRSDYAVVAHTVA